MRSDDEIQDLPRRLQIPGVSPVWRVLAIVSMIGGCLLVFLAIGLGVALLMQTRSAVRQQNGAVQVMPAVVQEQPALPMLPVLPNGNLDFEPEAPNPPYPLVADLQQAESEDDMDRPGAAAKKTARDRFLELGEQVWAAPRDQTPLQTTVSPDGKRIAYLLRQALWQGPIDGVIAPVIPGGWNLQPGRIGAGVQGGNILDRQRELSIRAVGNLTWSDDGRWLYFGEADGALTRFEVQSGNVERLPFRGESPLPLPANARKLIFRRSRAVPKVELPGVAAALDPSEIVLGDLDTKQVRVLVPESAHPWTPLAVSPDGAQLVLRSDEGRDEQHRTKFQLFLLDIQKKGKPTPPKPVGQSCINLQGVCWERDSRAFIYARSQEPMPPDCWEGSGYGGWGAIDLFHVDPLTARETRLSRGGSCDAPAVVGADLLFLTWKSDPASAGWRLYRLPLDAVRKFAEREPELPTRSREAWSGLLQSVLKEVGLGGNESGEQWTPEVLARLADTFARVFRERFKTDPPKDERQWDGLHQELAALHWNGPARTQATLVFGACAGEFLRRRHGAVWHLHAGPLMKASAQAAGAAEESPFGLVLNPFEAARIRPSRVARFGEDDDLMPAVWLVGLLRKAQGRPLVLTNDPADGKKAVEQLSDADLARAVELMEKNKSEEGERLLLELVKQPKHEKNAYLALHVCKLLHAHKRHEALRRLIEPLARQQPPDPVKWNLLGLALLDGDPQAAAVQFKTALRCNLHFGPAYLNLAQAYQNAKDPGAAMRCLRRYLKVLPYGPLASDARQRLASLQSNQEAAAALQAPGAFRPPGR